MCCDLQQPTSISLFPASLYIAANCNSAPISQTATNVKDSSQGEMICANQGGGGGGTGGMTTK